MNEQSVNILTYILIFMIVILVVLSIVFIMLKMKEKNSTKDKKNKTKNKQNFQDRKKDKKNIEKVKEYSKESIFSFMEFDKIEDNMIVKKEKKNYLMVVECQGINYDLMSGVEKSSVEQGFLQFLNTLRYPIQIYTQTRTVNLESSIRSYKDKIKDIQDRLARTEMDYRQKINSRIYSNQDLNNAELEVIKQRNLYEYGLDIIRNTEQMSFNKNILTKQYYIIISYYPEETENREFNSEEIKNLAFSELYTKAQSIVSSLFVCGINAKILNSEQLAELLYVAYNRDESEIYSINKAINYGYEELYSTAPDVFEKKIQELDKKIEEEAIRKANDVMLRATEESEKEKEAKEKEKKIDKLINDMAKMIIEQNENFFGTDITEKAKEILDNEDENANEKGGLANEKKAKKTTRRTSKTK